jgi:hypothetical protein
MFLNVARVRLDRDWSPPSCQSVECQSVAVQDVCCLDKSWYFGVGCARGNLSVIRLLRISFVNVLVCHLVRPESPR